MATDSIKKLAVRWGPAVLMMGLIFLFSSIPIKITQPLTGPFKLTPKLVLSKGAHMLGYALLALALMRGLQLRGWKGIVITLACVLVYALSDEMHQSFVPGRSARLLDVGIDMLGAILGLWVGRMYHDGWIFLYCWRGC